MSIKSIGTKPGDVIENNGCEVKESESAKTSVPAKAPETHKQHADPGQKKRLSGQILRGRLSVGSTFMQQRLSSILADSKPSTPSTSALTPKSTSASTGILRPEKIRLDPMPTSTSAPLVNAIKNAQTSVDISVYEFTNQDVVNALKDAAARGVKVRVMLEPRVVGVKDANKPVADQLRAAGIQVEDTPPGFDKANTVDHAKFMVIDNSELLFGTGNIVDNGLGGGNPVSTTTFNRDFWVEDSRGESIKEAHELFDADWNRQSTSGIDFQNLVVSPDNGDQKILNFIDGAQNTLYVYNQEIKDPTLINHLIAAKQRGVDVKLMIAAPHSSTDPSITTLNKIRAAGIDIAFYNQYYLHAKAMVADGNRAFIGSQNFSTGGLSNNRELGEITNDPGVVKQLTSTFNKDLKTTGLVKGDPAQGRGKVNLYKMPDSTDYAITRAINSAGKTIDLEVYQLTDPTVVDALKLAVKRGVQVRVMLEPGVISGGNYPQMAAELSAAGVQVQATPPAFDSNNNVDHAKFMVIDGKDMLFGTGNLTRGGLGEGGKPEYNNRDFWVEDTRAESTREAEALFNADWNRQDTKGINFKNLVVTPDNSNAKIINLIDSAKSRLYVYNQELFDPNVIAHLIAAKQRGVDVQVLLANLSQVDDSGNVQPDQNQSALQQLQAAGINAKEFTQNYLHAKAIVSDNKAFLGSQNFSVEGLTTNREVGEIFDNPKIVQQMVDSFLNDEANPTPTPAPIPEN